jgi:putative DNA primase/helicase
MALMGRRFVWASEVNNGRLLDLSQVKMLTGGDPLVGRDPFGKREVRFYPSHTIFLVTNVLPDVQHDRAYLHRQQILEFKYSYVDDPDPDDPYQRQAVRRFKDDLLQERTQILRWAVEGCIQYLSDGLNIPESVRSSAPAFCAEVETVNEFVKKCIENYPGGRIGKTEAFKAYEDFCIRNSFQALKHLAFAKAMKNKFEGGRKSSLRFYKNVRLAPRDAKQSDLSSERQAASK